MYNRKTWRNGEVITADLMNNLEEGVSEAKREAAQSAAAAGGAQSTADNAVTAASGAQASADNAAEAARNAQESADDAKAGISSHDVNNAAHADIRAELKALSDRINAVLNSDDTTLDELAEIVEYIKNNKTLIDAITTSKVSVSDVVDNLVTNVSTKPLSAAQGVALKALIDAITASKIGAVPATGGSMTGNIDFGNRTRGFSWTMDDGTLVAIRPDVDLNLFQVVFVPNGGTAFEAFGIKSDGTPLFHKPLPISEGGTGADTPAAALQKLGLNATAAELNYMRGVTSNVQTQLNGKLGSTATAASATKLATARFIRTNLGSASTASFDGSSDVSPGVTGILQIENGGTGGSDAQTARSKLGAAAEKHTHMKAHISDFPSSMPASDVYPWAKAATKPSYNAGEVGALPVTGGNMNGSIGFGQTYNNINWTYSDGRSWSVRPDPEIDMFQVVRVDAAGKALGYLNIDADGNVSFNKALAVSQGGTGAATKKEARKKLGAEIQCGVVDSVGTANKHITFGEAFSGIPVVTATGGSEQTSVYVTNITTTGFDIASGKGNNNGVQWQATYISN